METANNKLTQTMLKIAIGIVGVIILVSIFRARPCAIDIWVIEFQLPKCLDSLQLGLLSEQPRSGEMISNASSSGNGSSRICDVLAFNGNLSTTSPLFLRPDGFLSGWISSDPSTVSLSDGTTKIFSTQYVLVVEDLSFVQIMGVQLNAGKANTSGCWYPPELASFVDADAKTDFCQKKSSGSFAVYYKVNTSGFQELGTTATISCP